MSSLYLTWYTRCPACRLVGPPRSATYALAGPPPTDAPDWRQPAELGCSSCGHHYTVTADDLQPHDAEHTCTRCDTTTPVPSTAAEVVCRSCHLFAPGPAASTDQDVADKRRVTQDLHILEMQAAVQEAKRHRGL